MSKPQRRVTSDPTFAVDYLSDPISRDGKLTRQLSRRHTNSLKTLGENSSRMMDCCGHIAPRNGQAIPTDDKVLDDVRQSYINWAYSYLGSASPINPVIRRFLLFAA